MTRLARRLRALSPQTVLFAAWCVLFIYAFPGQMTQDSFDHLRETRAKLYSDAHPPSINLIWRVLDYIIAGPFLMFVLQSVMFVVGLYHLFRRTFAPRRAAWVTFAVYIFPPVMVPMAVIWKDCLMVGFLVLGAVGLLSERRTAKVWGLVALLWATAVRYNALGATLPLVVLLFEWRPGMHWLKRYALSTAVWLAITLAAFGLNAKVTDREMHYWQSSLALYDIVGTLAHVDEDLPDAELQRLLAGTELLKTERIHETIRAVYTPRDFFPIVNDPKLTMWNVPINGYEPAPQSQRDAISRAYRETLTTYPGAYAAHRLDVIVQVLGVYSRRAGAVSKREFYSPQMQHEMGLSTGWSRLQHKLTYWMKWLSYHTPLFVPFVYFVVTLFLLPLALRRREILAFLLSGLSMEGTLLFLAHSNDYRYSHWMVICTIFSAIVIFAHRYRESREGAGATATVVT